MSNAVCLIKIKIRFSGLDNFPGFFVFGMSVLLFVFLGAQPIQASDQVTKPNLMLLKSYQPNQDVTGWVMSEKLDGVRAYWDGTNLVSRQGNVFNAPKWFIKDFPSFELDGELWLARGAFEETISIVRRKIPDSRWKKMTYQVFEVPNQKGGLLERMSILKTYLDRHAHLYIKPVEQIKIVSNDMVSKELKRILALDGEGLVVRNPKTLYKTGRLSTALKIKQKQDAECVVKGYTEGLGKYTGLVGALKCELLPEQSARLFPKLSEKEQPFIKIGSGLSDEQRAKPPKIGSVVTFQYMGLTQKGLPRFPVFLRERANQEAGY
jgi:DNA ligase-1